MYFLHYPLTSFFWNHFCLFICSLFNDAVNIPNYKASNDWMIANDELERTWKGAVVY
jgi:hypothetical protein